jgi:leucyl aminopeptidase
MEMTIRRGDIATRPAGVLALGILEGTKSLSGAALAVDRAYGGALAALLASGDFRGRHLDTAVVHPARGRAKRILLVGLGPAAALDPHRVRQAAAVMARRARELRARTLVTVVHGAGRGGLPPAVAAQAVAEGLMLGHHRHTAYRTDPGPPPLTRIELMAPDAASVRALAPALERGMVFGEATCLARDLACTPGADLTPARLAARAREIARGAGARCTVLEPAQMERLGMECVLAVGRGSAHPPRFIVLDRAPRAARSRARARAKVPTVVLVGKGITFDTGGISLKPRDGMQKMKYDMSGAAAVLGAFAALPELDPPFRVVGLIPAAENMPGGRAFKPGDVVRALGGTTIEITNTDAEGRLVLADALGYAKRFAPVAVVDLATLTGAISIALGHQAAGLFSGDETLAAELSAAAARSAERVWRMPLWDECEADLRSDTADLVNSAARGEGAAISAAVFLRRFARGYPWAHLDIASTAWTLADRPHETRGPTGWGARLLLEWLSARADAARGA